MITAVSLNPSIDRTQHVESLRVGGLNRVCKQIDAAAGKGVNVALACAALGQETECIGFMYREGADLFERRLGSANVARDFIMCEGAVRVNTKVLDLAKGEITEFNTAGVRVDRAAIEAVNEAVRIHAASTDYMIFSGSVPPGCPDDYYRTLAQIAGEAGAKVILDADGERLRTGLDAAPFMIKPNRYELELLTGHILSSLNEVLDAAIACTARGVKIVVVSLGADGSIITDGKEAWRAFAPKLEIVSTVAAGDTMLAGLAAAFMKGSGLRDALQLGTAAASARCVTDPNLTVDGELCNSMVPQVKMEKLL